LVFEEDSHVRFNDNKPDKELSELYKSFSKLRRDEGISSKASVDTSTKAAMFTQPMDDPQEEVREPNGRNIQ